MKRIFIACLLVLMSLPAVAATDLRSQIEAMRPARHVWRAIAWRTCLLEGLQEARARNKPVFLWVFAHHPDNERC